MVEGGKDCVGARNAANSKKIRPPSGGLGWLRPQRPLTSLSASVFLDDMLLFCIAVSVYGPISLLPYWSITVLLYYRFSLLGDGTGLGWGWDGAGPGLLAWLAAAQYVPATPRALAGRWGRSQLTFNNSNYI